MFDDNCFIWQQQSHAALQIENDTRVYAFIACILRVSNLSKIEVETFFPHFLVNMAANEEAGKVAIHSSLVRARDIIVQLLDGIATTATTQQTITPTANSQPVATATNPVPSEPYSAASNNQAIEEHRRLFGFSGHSVGINAQSSGKRSRNGGKSGKKMKVATWTHSFVCLSKKCQSPFRRISTFG